MKTANTLLLSQDQVSSLITPEECIQAIERAFQLHGQGLAPTPGILGVHTIDGGFHIKAGILSKSENYFVAKVNANFPLNPSKLGLPTIQGIVVVCDAENGRLLCLMDSIEITILRTGAATAVAAKYLSRADSKTMMVWGCGNQGRISVRMVSKVRHLETVYAYDTNRLVSEKLAEDLFKELKLNFIIVENPIKAARDSDICVTCTPSREAILGLHDVSPGAFVAAVGADSEHKQELEPALLRGSKLVVDIVDQSASIGDLHHALKEGVMQIAGIHGELGEIVCGKKAGRESQDEIIIFDSTGMALQDVAAAAVVFNKAVSAGIGATFHFSY